MWWARLLNNLAAILSDAGAAATSYESIATVTVGAGGSSSITFSSIPSTYKHLQIRGISRATSTGANNLVQFNSDTGSNYAYHTLYGDGSSAAAAAATTQTSAYAGYTAQNGSTANAFSSLIIDILDYANTNKYKTLRSLNGFDNNGSGLIVLASGLWQNTNAISTVSFAMNTGNFAQYSSFALYGVKG